jgi:hypothetical protein
MNTVKAWTDYVLIRHNHSYSFLGNCSVASVNVGRIRTQWIGHNGRGIGPDHVFWSIAGKPKEMNLIGSPWLSA